MIAKSVILPLVPRAAFELFTQRIQEWCVGAKSPTAGSIERLVRTLDLKPNELFQDAMRKNHDARRDGSHAALAAVEESRP